MSGKELIYFKKLDAVRGLAILLVLVSHFAGIVTPAMGKLVELWGSFGVILFFCLSGFLITRILLRLREQRVSSEGLFPLYRSFYGRRLLRIFPIYYLTIIIACAFQYEPVTANLSRLLTFTANCPMPWQSHPIGLGLAGHFWSLSVEEQFYLVWPLLIFTVPVASLEGVIASVIGFSVVYRLLAGIFVADYEIVFRFVFSCMDALGIGALMALVHEKKSRRVSRDFLILLSRIALPVFLLITIVRPIAGIDVYYNGIRWLGVAHFFSCALVCISIVDSGINTNNDLVAKILNLRFLQGSGRMSYGLYVYHIFIPTVLLAIESKFGVKSPSGLLRFIEVISGCYLAATLSWNLIEAPILRLKKIVSDR